MKLPSSIFPTVCERSGLPLPVPEHRFHAVRKWRFDWAWPSVKVALEVEGGVWTHGRHTRASGFIGDMEKYNEATLAGWRVLRCVPNRLMSSETVELLRRAIAPTK